MDVYTLPSIAPDAKVLRAGVAERKTLLEMLSNQRIRLFDGIDPMNPNDSAKRALEQTFAPGYVDKQILAKVKLGPQVCERNGCAVDVTYPDWATVVALDHAVIGHQPPSAFMSFPGPRYRTTPVAQEGHKYAATWVLAFRLSESDGSSTNHRKDVP